VNNSGKSARRLLAVAQHVFASVRSRSSTPWFRRSFCAALGHATKTNPPDDAAHRQLPRNRAALGQAAVGQAHRHTVRPGTQHSRRRSGQTHRCRCNVVIRFRPEACRLRSVCSAWLSPSMLTGGEDMPSRPTTLPYSVLPASRRPSQSLGPSSVPRPVCVRCRTRARSEGPQSGMLRCVSSTEDRCRSRLPARAIAISSA